MASSLLPQSMVLRSVINFNGTSSAGQFIRMLHRVFMESVSKLFRTLGIQS